jgi:hypothetical protein
MGKVIELHRKMPKRIDVAISLADGRPGLLRFGSRRDYEDFMDGKTFESVPHPTEPRVRVARERKEA